MNYFQYKDETSLFCIANLSKLPDKLNYRFGVATCSVFWNYVSNLNQLKIKSSVKSGLVYSNS